MPGTTNFQQFNPPANNIESDANYTSDADRQNGFPSGIGGSGVIVLSVLLNKFMYQISTFVTAFANMLTTKGFSPNDGSASPGSALTNLQAVLANVLTNKDPNTVPIDLQNTSSNTSFGVENTMIAPTSIPGGLLGLVVGPGIINGAVVRFRCVFEHTGTNSTTYRVRYGSSNTNNLVAAFTVTPVNLGIGILEGVLYPGSVTTQQQWMITFTPPGGSPGVPQAFQTTAYDDAVTQSLQLSWQANSPDTNSTAIYTCEVLQKTF